MREPLVVYHCRVRARLRVQCSRSLGFAEAAADRDVMDTEQSRQDQNESHDGDHV